MKKFILVLLTAAIAASACATAACSKGQTGGGNNTLSGYTRETEGEGGYDCGCGKDCECDGNCGENCDCKEDCDCKKDDSKDDGHMHHRHGRRHMPKDERTGNMDGFEFDGDATGNKLGEKRNKFGIFAPDGKFGKRRPMPVPPPEDGDDAPENGRKSSETEQSGKDGANDGGKQQSKGEQDKKGGKGHKFFGGKPSRRPAGHSLLN